MSNDLFQREKINYRALYGKLFSSLLEQFGANYVSEIEDAIQNSFLKLLRIWDGKSTPNNKENWLFIVARNDVLSQIKAKNNQNDFEPFELSDDNQISENEKDLRLQTIIFIASLKFISIQAKTMFILKNIFGLSIDEIHDCTLLSREAIYKSINRTKKSILQKNELRQTNLQTISAGRETITILEEILYAVFNIGFDSFNDKTEEIVNKELCLETFSLAKLLFKSYNFDTTSNLLAIFSLHTARIPAKIEKGKLISFFNQKREKWNQELFQLGLQFLKKPKSTNKFYIEALIVSKYMTVENFTENDWKEIVNLYEILQQISSSPIVKLNYCYGLSKIGKIELALKILSEVEKELPNEHTYFNLVKVNIIGKVNPIESNNLLVSTIDKLNQKIRKEYLLENELIHL
ncbi:RNA polymerase [Riemerella anatipestifer]|nr:RNA polymerase [Riemerella anatipestifer]MDY3324543.1 RNA polymerase [Riemerella anatipestifer]MDY3353353.1 RNA polymerase [Riemerella anatipestifer]